MSTDAGDYMDLDEYESRQHVGLPVRLLEQQPHPAGALNGAVDTPITWSNADLTVLTGGRRPAPVLPLKVLGPFWSAWISDQAESKGAPADYVFGALLASSGSLIGNSRWICPWDGWREPPTLWMALIGNPSSGKSPAQDATLDLLRPLEQELSADHPERLRRYKTDKEAAKASKAIWEDEVRKAVKTGVPSPQLPPTADDPAKPCMPRLHITDATQERLAELLSENPKGLLLHRDELSGWMLNFDRYGGGGDRAFWLEAYGGRRYVVDRVKHADPVTIEHLSVSICGGIQPDRIATVMLSGDDDGLCARFLYIWPDPIACRRPERGAANDAAISALRRLCALRMSQDEFGGSKPVMVPLTEIAACRFQSWREENHRFEAKYAGRVLGHVGKYPGLTLRLALNLEFLWWSVGPCENEPVAIGEDALLAAIVLVEEYFRPMAERTFGDAGLTEEERRAVALAKWLRAQEERPTTINVRALQRKRLPGLRSADQVRSALKVLAEAGLVCESMSRPDAAGRPRGDYLTNPVLFNGEADG